MTFRRSYLLETVCVLLIVSAFAGSPAVHAADLLDAPGPGYRNFQLLPRYRPELLDALPPRLSPATRKQIEERAWEPVRKMEQRKVERREYFSTSPLGTSMSLSDPLSGTSLPLLERRPFDKPIRLFGSSKTGGQTTPPALPFDK